MEPNTGLKSNEELEYKEVIAGIRHQLDYRLKLFAIAIAVNGVLMTAVFEQLTDLPAKLAGCLFGFATTGALLLAEKRSVRVAMLHTKYGEKLEKKSELRFITEVVITLRSSKIRFRNAFLALYLLFLVLWISIAVYVFLS